MSLKMTLWIKVTNDELELPVAVADSAEELAKILNVSRTTIISAATRYERGQVAFSVYRKVEVEDEDDV